MGINTVILDISGTTLKSDGTPQPKIPQLLKFLRDSEINIVFVTNQSSERRKLIRSELPYDLLLSPIDVSYVKKPSPNYIDSAIYKLRTSYSKCIYVGDNDRTDAFCAANRKLLYFSAHWSNPRAKYGIKIQSPTTLLNYITSFLMKDEFWGWEYSGNDRNGFSIEAKTLFDSHNSGLKTFAVDALKRNHQIYLRKFAHHLIGSIYLSKIFHSIDIWSTYPSHNQGDSINKTLEGIIKVATQESHKLYLDLFIRHTTSKDSGKARYYGSSVDFENQISTVHLNPKYADKIKNKSILLIDDFITKGYSSECARNLLYRAGAKSVISIACGKYGDAFKNISIDEDFDAFEVINPDELTIYEKTVNGKFNNRVDKQIKSTLV